MLLARTRYAAYCPEHGLQFYNSEIDAAGGRCLVSGCNIVTAMEEMLLTETNCAFCDRTVDKNFVYDEKRGKVYCHIFCQRCKIRKCVVRDCLNTAGFVPMLIIDPSGQSELISPSGTKLGSGQEEKYVIATAFCKQHLRECPTQVTDAMLQAMAPIFNSYGRAIPKKEECRISIETY